MSSNTASYLQLSYFIFYTQVIDPWGTVIAECPEGIGVITAEIDLKYLKQVRTQMPVQEHHRQDLYGALSLHTKGSTIFSTSSCHDDISNDAS